jgi:hypothetical protein
LNSCKSAAPDDDLIAPAVPFAIEIADSIDDVDAISYAAQLYAAVTNGQSVKSAHLSGQASPGLFGLNGTDLATLAWAQDVDPVTTILVAPSTALGGSGNPSQQRVQRRLRIPWL